MTATRRERYKAFRERFHSDVECMVAHDGSFFVRDNNDGFHEVNGASDFDDYEAWIDCGYDNRIFSGQGSVALITPHGCLKWLEGEPVLLERGVMASNTYWRQ